MKTLFARMAVLLSCQQSVMEIKVAWKITFHLINEAEINFTKINTTQINGNFKILH